LRIWLTDFDGRRYYLADADIAKVRGDVEKFLLELKVRANKPLDPTAEAAAGQRQRYAENDLRDRPLPAPNPQAVEFGR
jgi:hypothetical protein